MAVTSVQEALNILNGLVSTQKVENEGINDQGKLSSEEWNAVVVVVNSLLKLGGHTNVADAVDSNAALNDQVLYRAAGESEWRIISVDSVPTNGSDNPVASGGVYIRLDAIAQTISELADNIAYIGEDDGEGGVPTGGGSTPVDLTDYALKTWVAQNFLGKTSMDTTPTANSTNPVTSGGVKQYVDSHGGSGGGSSITTFHMTPITVENETTYDFGETKFSDISTAIANSDIVLLVVTNTFILQHTMTLDDGGVAYLFSGISRFFNLGIATIVLTEGVNDSILLSYETYSPQQPDWGESNTGSSAYIKNKPTLSDVALTGNYNHLTNIPIKNISESDLSPTVSSDITTGIYREQTSDTIVIVNRNNDDSGEFTIIRTDGTKYHITFDSQGDLTASTELVNVSLAEKHLWNAASQSLITISENNLDTATTLGIYKVTGTAGTMLQNSKPYLMLVNEYNVTTMRPTVTTTHYICQTRFQGSLITQRRKADGGTWSEWEDAYADIKALKSDVRVIPVDSSSYGDLDAIDNIMENEVPLEGLFYVTIQHVDSIETILVNQHWNEDVGVRQIAYTKDGIKKRFWDEEVQVWGEWEWVRDDTKADKVEEATANNAAALDANGNIKDSGVPAAGIPFGRVDSTSTATAFTATVPGITELRDGVCVLLENGVVTSAAGFTLNINGLGAKPSFNNMTAATRDTTIFNVNYTMLFVYDATRVVDGITGAWCCYRGYDANTNTIGYQVRTNSSTLPVSDQTGRYRLLFTSADGSKYVPATTSTSTNATSSRAVNQRPIDPHGAIVYYSSTTVLSANGNVGTSSQWQQYTLTLGYSFNRTGAALVLSYPKPVYVKCAPQTDGSAIIDADTPYVQALPTTADGKIYIYLGRAYSATAIELTLDHPVYHYYNGAIRRWLGPV